MHLLVGSEVHFKILNSNVVTTQGVQYDSGSIMHSASKAFSNNLATYNSPIRLID